MPIFVKIGPFFSPIFGCETHINGRDNPKFWYFFSLTKTHIKGRDNPKLWYLSLLIKIWKWPEFEKNRQFRSWAWFYNVSWKIGCGPTPIWAEWDPKYFSHLNNFQKGLMRPSFSKIPKMVVLNFFTRCKICLLSYKQMDKDTFEVMWYWEIILSFFHFPRPHLADVYSL